MIHGRACLRWNTAAAAAAVAQQPERMLSDDGNGSDNDSALEKANQRDIAGFSFGISMSWNKDTELL